MEYPTLFTADGSWTGIFKDAEITTEHEFGHQYWYGMVASNEFEEAWLDEGINSYSEVKVLAALLGAGTSAVNQRYANLGDGSLQRIGYLSSPDSDPVTRFAWKFRNEQSYGAITYGKSATLLATLEGMIGTDTMNEVMRTYFERVSLHASDHRRLPPHDRAGSSGSRQGYCADPRPGDLSGQFLPWPASPVEIRSSNQGPLLRRQPPLRN